MKKSYLREGYKTTIEAFREIIRTEQIEIGFNIPLPIKVSIFQSFLHHHLKSEKNLTSNPSAQYIRYRQIIQHTQIKKVESSPKHMFLLTLLKKVWMKTLFTNCIQNFERRYFTGEEKISKLKLQVADQFLFELNQLREFIEAGFTSISKSQVFQQFPLSNILTLSDEVLYEVIQQKTKANQQQQQVQNVEHYSKIKDLKKQKYDILKMFEAKCLKYTDHAIKDFIYEDLKYILNSAIEQFQNFKTDMKAIFGPSIQCDLKVKKILNKFNVIGIRRLLSKWVQSLLETDKQLVHTSAFHQFIKNKKNVFDNFYIKASQNIPAIHQKIITLLLDFLISSVFKEKKFNQNFGLFIYDILRSKICVDSFQKIENLIKKLQNQKKTIRKIKIFRIKNRLSTHNKDVMVNFIYGNFLPAQIQIGLGKSSTDKQKNLKKNKYEFKHYLYELSRSIFGPTMELIIFHQDEYKKNIEAKMYSIGKVNKRDRNLYDGIQYTQLQCSSRHKLLYITSIQFLNKRQVCRNCFKQIFKESFLYCYQCTLIYCQNCCDSFKENNIRKIQKSINIVVQMKNIQQLTSLKGFNLVIYILEYSPASKLILNYLNYFGDKLKSDKINIYYANITKNQDIKNLVTNSQLQLSRFPAFVLYNNNIPAKKLIGASIFQIFDLINIMQNECYSKMCPNQHELSYIKPSKFHYWKCNQCSESRENLKTQEVILFCKQCFYICCNRCGFSKNDSKQYEDQLGISYLSTPLLIQKEINCVKQPIHRLKLIHQNPFHQLEYHCVKCQNPFFFIQESGMYICEQCKEYYCNQCSNYGFINMINKKQLANHFVQFYNLQVPLCTCGFPFKNTYRNTKKLITCRCFYCKQDIDPKTLKISCFRCSVDICQKCITNIKNDENNDVTQYSQTCTCTGKIIKYQNKSQNYDSLTFLCTSCCNRYYIHSNHYECSKCRFKICRQCIKKKKLKIKIYCFQLRDEASHIKQFQTQFESNLTLQNIQDIMKKWKLIEQNSKGHFKKQNDWQSQQLSMATKIHETQKNTLYYFQYFEVLQKAIQIILLPENQNDTQIINPLNNIFDLSQFHHQNNNRQNHHNTDHQQQNSQRPLEIIQKNTQVSTMQIKSEKNKFDCCLLY